MFYGRIPKHFNNLKEFRAIIYPGEGCCKGTIIQGMQLPSGLPTIGQSILIRKGYITGAYVYAPRQKNSPYRQTYRKYIYHTK